MGVRSTFAQFRFNAGQLGVRLKASFDLPFYSSGCEKLLNFIPYIQGPARFREGLRFADNTEDLSALVPFIFSNDQSYMLLFTHRRMRVYKDGALLLGPNVGPVTNLTQEEPTFGYFVNEFTVTAHGLSDFDEVIITGINGADISGPFTYDADSIYPVEVIDPNTFQIVGKVTGAFVASPGSTVRKVAGCVTPYRAYDDGSPGVFTPPAALLSFDKSTLTGSYTAFVRPEFLDLQFAQANDTMYIVQENCAPAKLTRTSELVWACATYSRTADPFTGSNWPIAITFYEQRLIYGGLVTTPQGIKGSQTGDFEDHTTGSLATDSISFTAAVRRLNAIQTLFSNENFLLAGTSESTLRMTGANGDALSPANPPNIREVDGDGVAPIMPVTVDSCPVYVRRDKRKLYALKGDDVSGKPTPDDLTKLSDEILNGQVRKMAYQRGTPNVLWVVLEDGTLKGLNLDTKENVLGWHPHVTRPGDIFKDVATIPNSSGRDVAYFLIARQIDGETVTCLETLDLPVEYPRSGDYYTGDKEADLESYQIALYEAQKQAFHLDCGLTYDGSDRSMTMTPAAASGTAVNFTAGSSLFVSGDVGREIWEKNGRGRAVITAYTSATIVVCEITSPFTSASAMAAGNWYLTIGTVTGLDHLEGETVQVVVDGTTHADCVVESGSITLTVQGSVVHAGLGYTGIIKSMNIESGGMNGPAQGRVKNVSKMVVKFLDTLGAKYGTNLYDLSEINWREGGLYGQAPLLFTGEKELPNFDTRDTEKHFLIVQDKPLPCTVLMVAPSLTTAVD